MKLPVLSSLPAAEAQSWRQQC